MPAISIAHVRRRLAGITPFIEQNYSAVTVGDTVQIVSDSADDTGIAVTICGPNQHSELLTLNGITPVAGVLEFAQVYGVVIHADHVGTVTVTSAADAAIGTLPAGTNSFGGMMELYDEVIGLAHRHFEREMQIFIDPTRILMQPASDKVKGVDYDQEEAALPYITGLVDSSTLPRWNTRRRPVISVQSCRLSAGENYLILDIPLDWCKVNKHLGRVEILPIGTSAIAMSMGAWYAPLLDRSWKWKFIPQFVHIDYTAGWENPLTNEDLGEMRVQLARQAAITLLRDHRRLVPSNFTLEGFNQSFDSVERIVEQESKLVEKFIADWQKQNRPMRMVII